ncbi:ATP synthase subunit I [Actinokineospora enzanensis]|uniref:ATP synthase subunit I n=1 Tax=Actinokineospora enzanensis TaxID=155975 RepID=UPI00035C9877|nr:ATP synthase subunit I [Actinokineospora enzanensis]
MSEQTPTPHSTADPGSDAEDTAPATPADADLELDTLPAPSSVEEAQLMLADTMYRAARWPVLGALVLGLLVWVILGGFPGLWSSAIGGAVATASGYATIMLMRRTVKLDARMLMVAALGGFVAKMFVLLITLVLLRAVPGVHVYALATTMLAVVLANAAAETVVFKRTRIATLILPAQPDGEPSTTEN